MKVIYEVTAVVRPDLKNAYEEYMIKRHIPDLLSTGYFTGASIARHEQDARYSIRYECSARADLDQYLAKEAPRLRQDLLDDFPEGIELSRDIWNVLYDHPEPVNG